MADLEICLGTEQRSVIKLLAAGQCKPDELFQRMSAVYEEETLGLMKKCLQMD